MRVGIYGCGAMGTVLGAFLAEGGVDVELIDIFEEHVKKLNSVGATLTGFEKKTVHVNAILPTEMSGIYDLIILLCKQTVNDIALKTIKPFTNKDSSILTIQNGVPEPGLLEYFDEEQILGGTILWGATFVEPGVSEVSEPLSEKSVLFEIGTMSGEINKRINDAADILRVMGPTVITENLMGARWSKLVMNSAVSGLSSALGTPFGYVLEDKKCAKLIGQIGKEAGLCAKADGVHFAPYGAAPIDPLLRMGNNIAAKIFSFAIRLGYKNMHSAKASMLQDLEKGRRTEVDMINGYISKTGKKHGIATPVNDKIVEIIHGIEDGKYPLSPENLSMFDI